MESVLYGILNDIKAIDEKIKDLNKKKQIAPSKLLNERKRLAEIENKYKTKTLEFDIEDKKQKHLKGIVTDEKAKLEKAEQKLSLVKNTKEYQAALKEVSQLKKTLVSLEEQLRSKDSDVEKLTKDTESLKTELDSISKSYEQIMVHVKDELISIESELNDLIDSKLRYTKDLPDNIKGLYQRLYDNKNGMAITIVKESRCSVCNLSLPRQLCNEIMKGDKVHHCPSCQRLIICVNKD